MILRKTLLAASAVALLSTPAWALADQEHSGQGAKHAPSSTPVGPPSTTPSNTDNPGAANRHSKGNDGNQGTSSGSGPDNQSPGNHPDKPSHPGHPSHPEHPKHPGHPGQPSHPGKSHKCMAHNVAYVASGTLTSQTLVKNTDGTYSGSVTVNITHTNRHAAGDKGTQSYTLTNVHVTFGLADTNNDGSVGPDDLTEGDGAKLIGKITTLAKKCDQSGFTATKTIRKIVFHAPK
jgi:hypothetical protein